MKNIVVGNLAKRVLASILDVLLFIFSYLVLVVFAFNPLMDATMNLENNINSVVQMNVFSHLYVYVETDNNGVSRILEVNDLGKINLDYSSNIISVQDIEGVIDNPTFQDYEKYVRYYYLSYKTGLNLIAPSENFDLNLLRAPNYNEPLILADGSEILPSEYYTFEWYLNNIVDLDNPESLFVLNSENSQIIELKEDNDVNALNAINFFKQAIYEANADMYYSPYYQEYYQAIMNATMAVYLPPFFICLLIYYFMVPLLFKNGETLCKKMLSLGLINEKEFQVSKLQIFLRQLVFIFEICVFFFVIPIFSAQFNINYILSYLATLLAGCFVLFIITIFNKKHKTLHDYIALTYVIDTKKSVWFDNLNQEEDIESELARKIAAYKKKPLVNQNIIQIGDKIVNQDAVDKLIKENSGDLQILDPQNEDKNSSLTKNDE